MPKPTLLNAAELATVAEALPDWAVSSQELTRSFEFAHFMDGIAFVKLVAEAAEAANHHPDLDIRYTMVTVSLTTHDAGGVTEKDSALASTCEELFQRPEFIGDEATLPGMPAITDEGDKSKTMPELSPVIVKPPIVG